MTPALTFPEPAASADIAVRRAEAIAWLYGRINYEETPAARRGRHSLKLERMRDLFERLGRPAVDVPTVHIAGTKGKGSTAAMVASILQAAGYRTGLFTSPHLEQIEERFWVDGQFAAQAEFVELVEAVRPAAGELEAKCKAEGKIGPTFFELCTALALLHFGRRQVEAMVLEVGLGGRLDATNICRPSVSLITSISYDHTRQLGNTLREIAREKAGIIKPGVPVVSGVTQDEPRRVIEQIAKEKHCRLLQLGRDFAYHYRAASGGEDPAAVTDTFDFLPSDTVSGWSDVERADLPLPLWGEHQAANAAVAVAGIGELVRQGWEIAPDAVRAGLQNARLPARAELVGRAPSVILDTAHNVASVRALVQLLETHFTARRRHLVFAATQDKDVSGMLEVLLPHFDTVWLTRYTSNPRGVPGEELARLVRDCLGKLDLKPAPSVTLHEAPLDAWRAAREAACPEDLICITGSFFLAAELRGLVVKGRHPHV